MDPILFAIRQLPGERKFDSPLDAQKWYDNEFIRVECEVHQRLCSNLNSPILVEQAGPRKKLYFDPSKVTSTNIFYIKYQQKIEDLNKLILTFELNKY
jgi:hypothetical protein